LILLLRLTTRLVAKTSFGKPAESIQSGNYGQPPNAWWWLKQSLIYFCGLMGMKLCVLILFMVLPWISRVGDWALGWTEGNEKLQIVFVMMLFPLIMNAMQYYIIDSFIKKKEDGSEAHDEHSHGQSAAYDQLSISDGSDVDEDEMDDDQKNSNGAVLLRQQSHEEHEYNPAVDGDSRPASGSSSRGKGRPGKPVSRPPGPRE
jgi:hypothetical protein